MERAEQNLLSYAERLRVTGCSGGRTFLLVRTSSNSRRPSQACRFMHGKQCFCPRWPVVFSFGSISAFGPLSESQLLPRISSARIVWGFPFGLVASAGCIRGNTRSPPTPELRGKSTPYFRLPLRGDFSEWIPLPRPLTVRLCDSNDVRQFVEGRLEWKLSYWANSEGFLSYKTLDVSIKHVEINPSDSEVA